MAWKDLSIAQRSQLMNLYRRNGITDLASMRENYDIFSSQENTDPYLQYEHSPWFALGGNKFSGNETASQRKNYNGQAVTLETYKEMQRQAIRDAAVKRALSRTTGVAPTINGKAAASCIYTLTDSYGNKYRVADTKQLAANPQKYGWEVSGPVSQGMEGNIYMMMDKNGIPYHANMITSYDKSGNPLVTYSAGNAGGIAQPMSKEEWERSQGQTAAFQAQLAQLGRQAKQQTYNDYLAQFNIANSPEADYKKNKQVWDSPAYETYRFIGTPDDNTKWAEEWNNLQGYTQLPQLDTLTAKVRMAGGGNKYGGGSKKKAVFDKPLSWYIQQKPELYPRLSKVRPEYLDKYFKIEDGKVVPLLYRDMFIRRREELKKSLPDIPYTESNEIMLTTNGANARYRTGRISTDVLDYIYDNAAKAGIPFKEAVGLAGKESTLGIGRGYKRGSGISPFNLYSYWVGIGAAQASNSRMKKLDTIYNQLYNGEQIDENALLKTEEQFKKYYEGLHDFEGDNLVKSAYDYYKAGKYNPGEKGYNESVLTQGDAILSDKAVQKWLATKQPYKGRGFAPGGAKGGGSRGKTEFIQRVANWYHKNADKIPPIIHRTVYDSIKDASFGDSPIEDAIRNIIPNYKYAKNNPQGVIDDAFLMSPEQQEKALSEIGYHRLDSQDYGLVNSAVSNYIKNTGRQVPIYQYGEDDISRENLIPLSHNIYSRFVDTVNVEKEDPLSGLQTKNAIEMGDIGSSPIRFYRDNEGNLFYKRWDFFDHGNYSRRSYTGSDDEYVTKALTDNSERYGNTLDNMGNPYVKTTGFKRVNNVRGALQSLVDGKAYLFGDDEYSNILDRVKAGEFDIKASGGPIYIKHSRRGTFTAAATKHGMGVQEFATHVLANKDDYSSKMIKKAVFAKNFGKKSYGGVKF